MCRCIILLPGHVSPKYAEGHFTEVLAQYIHVVVSKRRAEQRARHTSCKGPTAHANTQAEDYMYFMYHTYAWACQSQIRHEAVYISSHNSNTYSHKQV